VLKDKQEGFRKSRKYEIRYLISGTSSSNVLTGSDNGLFVNFINFQKAFNIIPQSNSLWTILRNYGIYTRLINSNFSCTVGTSDMRFAVKSRLKLGMCNCATLLFNTAID